MRKILILFAVMILFLTMIFTSVNINISTIGTSIVWSSSISATESNERRDNVQIGEASDAMDGLTADIYDVLKPPTPIAPYLRLSLNDNLPIPYDTLWKDFRQYPGLSKIWNLSVQWIPQDYTSSTIVTLSWNSNEYENSEYDSVMLCSDTGTPLLNMLTQSSYSFTCPAMIPQNFKISCTRTNHPPEPPNTPNGDTSGYHGTSFNYSTSSIDSDGDDLYYRFDWGDNITSSWLGPYQSNELIWATHIWKIPGSYELMVKASDIYGEQSNWSAGFFVEMMNRDPSMLQNPFPQNGAVNVQSAPTLSWTGADPDGDILSYSVFFGTINPPEKLVDNQSGPSFHPGSLDYDTTYYWKIVSSDGFGGTSSSPVWSFITQASDGGSEQPGNDTNQTNRLPIADASLSEQTGFVGTYLVFNGSRSIDPDGYLTKWTWDFGDGSNGSGERTTHMYQRLGVYSVLLTATDDDGETGIDSISVEVGTANWPPTKPSISGTRIGTKNQVYLYAVSAGDADNDFLQYTVSWGDGRQNTSQFLPNGSVWSVSHSWNASGKYLVRAKATDNSTLSEQTTMEVFIDVTFVSNLGFLFDGDNNGQVDSFFINDTGTVSHVQSSKDGSYYLDTDDDGNWNYLYNPSSGSLTPLRSNVTTIENPWFFISIICAAVIIIGIIVYLYKKNYF